MIERITEYPGYLIRFSPDKPSRKAILLLHGFPAARGVKNLDIADYLCRHVGHNVYILHYKGLGESRGTFLFTPAVQEAVNAAESILNDHGMSLDTVIGHSWGGLVALNVAHQISHIKKLVLLSPLCELSKENTLYEWFVEGVKEDWPGIYGALSRAEVEADVVKVADQYAPYSIAPKIPKTVSVHVIQSKQDDTTPPEATKVLCTKFVRKPEYLELDLDHSFTQDRPLLGRTIASLLKSSSPLPSAVGA